MKLFLNSGKNWLVSVNCTKCVINRQYGYYDNDLYVLWFARTISMQFIREDSYHYTKSEREFIKCKYKK